MIISHLKLFYDTSKSTYQKIHQFADPKCLPVCFRSAFPCRIVIRQPPLSGSVSYLSWTAVLVFVPSRHPSREPPPAVPVLLRPLDFLQNDWRVVRYVPSHFL